MNGITGTRQICGGILRHHHQKYIEMILVNSENLSLREIQEVLELEFRLVLD